jgi:methylenetetrahydrofolate reductase (NADPH)
VQRIRDLYHGTKPVWTFEVYPPKTEQGLEPLYHVVAAFRKYNPGFISVTYGAGGGTRELSLRIAADVVKRFGLPVTSHLTCVGSTVGQLREWLREAKEFGVANVMALRGDPPAGQATFAAVDGGFHHALDLVRLLKAEFPEFGVGVAGYPETHQEATSSEDDLRHLRDKVAAGGDAVYTQLFYDNDDFFRFRDRCRKEFGIDRPIVPGLLPILSLAQVKRITSLCKACLPDKLVDALDRLKDDPESQISVGVEHCRRQVEGLLAAGVPGVHFYVLNRSDTIDRILEGMGVEGEGNSSRLDGRPTRGY